MLSILLLIFGVFCCATSVLMIKASGLHPAVLSAYRLLGAALLLSPMYVAQVKKHRGQYSARHLRTTVLPALTLALNFISWAKGAQWTRAANATLIVNMSPLVMPFLLFLTLRERVTRREIMGTLIALVGVIWLASSDLGLGRRYLLGDLTCFGSMILFSFYLVQARLNRDVPMGPHPAGAYWAALGLAVVPFVDVVGAAERRVIPFSYRVCQRPGRIEQPSFGRRTHGRRSPASEGRSLCPAGGFIPPENGMTLSGVG